MEGGVDDLGRAVRGGRSDVVTLDRRGQGHLVRVRMGGRVRGRVRVRVRARVRARVRVRAARVTSGSSRYEAVATGDHLACVLPTWSGLGLGPG